MFIPLKIHEEAARRPDYKSHFCQQKHTSQVHGTHLQWAEFFAADLHIKKGDPKPSRFLLKQEAMHKEI